jgi:hypothetical protein
MRPVVVLPRGLQRWSELFWEIWRRASRAQGDELPISGAFDPINPPRV